MSKLRIWIALIVVIVVAGVAVYFGVLRGRRNPPTAAGSPARSIANLSPEEKRRAYDGDVKALQDRLAHMQTFVDRFSQELVDVAALGRSLTTPEAAFAYVRDEVALEPYPGVMKGAGGTLVARGGNTVDRALLLASLLAENGIDARIARGKLPAPQAEALLQQISNAPDAIQLIAR